MQRVQRQVGSLQVGDVPSPLKIKLNAEGNDAHKGLCDHLDDAISAAYGFAIPADGSEDHAVFERADHTALLIEARALLQDMGTGVRRQLEGNGVDLSAIASARELDALLAPPAHGSSGAGGAASGVAGAGAVDPGGGSAVAGSGAVAVGGCVVCCWSSVCVPAGAGAVVVGVAGSRFARFDSPPNSVVWRPPPEADSPATSSGRVTTSAQMTNPSKPVMIARRQREALREERGVPAISPLCATRVRGSGSSPCGRVPRTAPRTGTARLTTSVGRWSPSLMTATSTGVNAADSRVPGAHTFEQTYAAAAEATAVISNVVRSMRRRSRSADIHRG